jgi:hypothetical protein
MVEAYGFSTNSLTKSGGTYRRKKPVIWHLARDYKKTVAHIKNLNTSKHQ